VEAVELLTQARDEVAVALLDVVMPRLGGRAAAHRMRELRPDLPIVFASGYDPEAVGGTSLTELGDDFLAKPYRAEQLLAKLREVLDR
jgi:CheY-like chemotaxis protein